MPGISVFCLDSKQSCTIFKMDKIKKYPIDTEQGIMTYIDTIYDGEINKGRLYIYTRLNPCMICLHHYDLFLQEHKEITIDVYYDIVEKKDRSCVFNNKYDLSSSRIYSKIINKNNENENNTNRDKTLCDEYKNFFVEGNKIPSLVLHHLPKEEKDN